MSATEPMSPELTRIVALRDAFIAQFNLPPDTMTLPPPEVNALNGSPWFKRTTFSSIGALGTFMGMSILAGSPMRASNANGSNTMEVGELPDV